MPTSIGDVMEAIETCSGHIVTTHVHDNRRQAGRPPRAREGAIDWEGVVMAFQKVGYDGAWMFELAPSADDWRAVLERAAARAGRRSSACCDVEQ